jgi:hypothetical protein
MRRRRLQGERTAGIRPFTRRGVRVLALLAVAITVLAGPAAVSAVAKPEYVNAPEVVGRIALGERLVCASGTWKGSPKFSYEWFREGIPFSTLPSYSLRPEDEHKEVWCVVTATENSPPEVSFAESVNSVCLGGNCGIKEPPIAPEDELPPKATGNPKVGEVLTCSPGTWRGRPTPTFSYKWLRDGNEAIKGATNSSYTIVAEDEAHELSCRVTGQNEAGEATAESNRLLVPGTAPENTVPPKVVGVLAVGEALTCNEGTWKGSAPLTFEFRWLRNGLEIGGATGTTYIVASADEGQALSCKVTATNVKGHAQAISNPAKVNAKLKNTELPAISGTPEEGQTLTCSKGKWNQGTLPPKFLWVRDNVSTGATSEKYVVANADRGHLLYCQVTAKSETTGEEVTATSEPVGVKIGPGVPEPVGLPELSGTAANGHTLTCHEGSWTHSPTNYVFQWLRDKEQLGSAKNREYEIKVADEGHSLSCRVIAVNAQGPSVPADSLATHVSGEAPSLTKAVEVSGPPAPRIGESLTCLRGEWKGAPAPAYTYEWLREGTIGSVGTNAAYTITSADRGHLLSCAVTASNGEGSARAASSNELYIPGSPPEPPLGGPTISASAEPVIVGTKLTCNEGAWTGAPAPTFTFQWLLNGGAIPGQTSNVFTVTGADRGFVISCKVTGTSGREGSTWAVSKGVHVPGNAPEVVEPPFVTGTPSVGLSLSCQRGVWAGKPPPSFSYGWLRDGVAITGATESTYTVQAADEGHLLSCVVTGANPEGRVPAESINSAAVATHVPPSSGGGGGSGTFVAPRGPSAGVILASLNRQLSFELSGLHIKKVLKAGGYSFTFIAPTGGKFEVLWYILVKSGHGKLKQLVIGGLTSSYTHSTTSTIKLKLTTKGRQLLKGRKRLSLKAKAVFTPTGGKPVTWYSGLSLSR